MPDENDVLDPIAILDALGIRHASMIERVRGGWDAALWRVEHEGNTYALRVFGTRQAGQCRREALVMHWVAAAGNVPVPEVFAEGIWRAHPALLLGWCPGRPLGEALWDEPGRAEEFGILFGHVQARMHALEAPPELQARERQAGADWVALAGASTEALQTYLRGPTDGATRLIHLDYHPLNVMLDPRAGHISGVLDWANSRAGDPRADIARTVAIAELAAGGPDGLDAREKAAKQRFMYGWRTGYAAEAGAWPDEREMAPFYAWAGAMMFHDLAPQLGRPGVWLEQRHLEAVLAWTERWRRRWNGAD